MDRASPILMWFRRDLRLSDHAALTAACATGKPVVPVFICDDQVDALGAAPKWRLHQSLEALSKTLSQTGSRLILRRGAAAKVLDELVIETGASGVFWSRLYDPAAVKRDTEIKSLLRGRGLDARSFGGHVMFEPWSVETKTGSFYKVFTPMWRAVQHREVDAPRAAPSTIPSPDVWPDSDVLADWRLTEPMNRGGAIVKRHARIGEAAAHARLAEFTEHIVQDYKNNRDFPAIDGTSNLSENLALGEITPHQCWHAGLRARHEGKSGAETFLKELVWREFAYHLMHHTPRILTDNWKPDWDAFGWNTDEADPLVLAWKQGRTGIPFVDAAMREMYVTGRMHNRGRMIVASYLTKHLLTHWKIGMKWFEDCLTDWDPASNAMGWQWAAGSGPDAAPYFRVFNPVTQLEKFDRDRRYADRWIAEGKSQPHRDAQSYFDAVPARWGLSPADPYPAPLVTAEAGRRIALAAYENRGF